MGVDERPGGIEPRGADRRRGPITDPEPLRGDVLHSAARGLLPCRFLRRGLLRELAAFFRTGAAFASPRTSSRASGPPSWRSGLGRAGPSSGEPASSRRPSSSPSGAAFFFGVTRARSFARAARRLLRGRGLRLRDPFFAEATAFFTAGFFLTSATAFFASRDGLLHGRLPPHVGDSLLRARHRLLRVGDGLLHRRLLLHVGDGFLRVGHGLLGGRDGLLHRRLLPARRRPPSSRRRPPP